MKSLRLSGAPNARDLGGIATKFGTVQTGRLIRSGELSRLTAEDVAVLKSVPLTRIVDLRTQPERDNSPDVEIEGVEQTSVHIIRATTFGITYEKSSGEDIVKMLNAGFARMSQRNETYEEHMILLYHKFVEDEFSRNGYGQFLRLLANEPTKGATLWHCTMGKDRVGTCTALLLHCLDATTEQIFEDYLLTNSLTAQNRAGILCKVEPYLSPSNLKMVENMLCASPDYLNGFYEEIKTRFGNVDSFLQACNVTQQDKENLRKNYLE